MAVLIDQFGGALVLPHGEPRPFLDGDHQGVGQQPHHLGGADPADLLHPPLQATKVKAEDRFALIQLRRLHNVGG